MKKRKNSYKNNYKFLDSAILNNLTFNDYLDRFRKVALSVFEWVNLPESMDSRYLERCLFYDGKACLLKDENYGFINTKCTSNGNLNIYGLPTDLNCYSYEYSKTRKLYSGLIDRELQEQNEAILVMNNFEMIPTAGSMELFAYRLYEAERTTDTNIKSCKMPLILLADDKLRLTLENFYSQYDGNKPCIITDKNNLGEGFVKALDTGVEFIADKLMDYKKEIWNEALTFLGINNIMVDKKERLITDEANSNNELINLNLQSYLAPRQKACSQFNELFGFTGTDKEISVRVRSDLHNIIKNAESIVNDYKTLDIISYELNGGDENGNLYNRTSQNM